MIHQAEPILSKVCLRVMRSRRNEVLRIAGRAPFERSSFTHDTVSRIAERMAKPLGYETGLPSAVEANEQKRFRMAQL
jgi:hypothetical protein